MIQQYAHFLSPSILYISFHNNRLNSFFLQNPPAAPSPSEPAAPEFKHHRPRRGKRGGRRWSGKDRDADEQPSLLIPVIIVYAAEDNQLTLAQQAFARLESNNSDIRATLHSRLTVRHNWDTLVSQYLGVWDSFLLLRPDRPHTKSMQIHHVTAERGREFRGSTTIDNLVREIRSIWNEQMPEPVKQITTSRGRQRERSASPHQRRSSSRSRSRSPRRSSPERTVVYKEPTSVKQELEDMSVLEKRQLRFGSNSVRSLETP